MWQICSIRFQFIEKAQSNEKKKEKIVSNDNRQRDRYSQS